MQNDLVEFKSKALALMQTIEQCEKSKAEIVKREDDMRKSLLENMEKYGVDKLEGNGISVTYVPSSIRTSIDSTKLKKEMPEVAAHYTKTTTVKPSLRITIK